MYVKKSKWKQRRETTRYNKSRGRHAPFRYHVWTAHQTPFKLQAPSENCLYNMTTDFPEAYVQYMCLFISDIFRVYICVKNSCNYESVRQL